MISSCRVDQHISPFTLTTKGLRVNFYKKPFKFHTIFMSKTLFTQFQSIKYEVMLPNESEKAICFKRLLCIKTN